MLSLRLIGTALLISFGTGVVLTLQPGKFTLPEMLMFFPLAILCVGAWLATLVTIWCAGRDEPDPADGWQRTNKLRWNSLDLEQEWERHIAGDGLSTFDSNETEWRVIPASHPEP